MQSRILFLLLTLFSVDAFAQSILVYTKNGEGYVHDNIDNCVKMFQKIGAEHGYEIIHSDDPSIMNEDQLQKFDAIVFANSNNEGFDNDQQRLAFQKYIMSGGGFMGIHSASGSERQWPWFWSILGGKFKRHPKYQEFTMKVLDTAHPSVAHLGDEWTWTDECYFLDNLNPLNQVVLAADLSSVEDEGKKEYPGSTFGQLLPLSMVKGTVWRATVLYSPGSFKRVL